MWTAKRKCPHFFPYLNSCNLNIKQTVLQLSHLSLPGAIFLRTEAFSLAFQPIFSHQLTQKTDASHHSFRDLHWFLVSSKVIWCILKIIVGTTRMAIISLSSCFTLLRPKVLSKNCSAAPLWFVK